MNPDNPENDRLMPVGGVDLSKEEAEIALREALQIIEKVGTTGVYDVERAATAWVKKYFPAYAN